MNARAPANPRSPRLEGIATAVPEHAITQDDARAFAAASFAGRDDMNRLGRLFARTGIERRFLVRPLDWFLTPRSFEEKNAVYVSEALALAERAARGVLEGSAVDHGQIGGLVFVSTTGVATPSLDATLVQRLDLPRGVARVPVFGFGCAGGAAGLDRARALCTGLGKPVLLVSVEICSTTFVVDDARKSNVVATALFADGAAAAVITPGGPEVGDEAGVGLELIDGVSRLIDDSVDVMGWDVTNHGLRVRFSPHIPQIAHTHMPALMAAAERVAGRPIDDLVAHPGGRRVLEAYEDSLGWSRDRFAVSWETLRDFGNMSGPTVLFALDRYLRSFEDRRPRSGRTGFALGLGPGFCAEGVVFRW